jgi:hypothetical protein
VGYNGRKTPVLWDTMQENLLCCIRQRYITYHIMEYNAGKIVNHPYSQLYPTTEENLHCCIPQLRKISTVVSDHIGKPPLLFHNKRHAAALYPTMAKKLKN